MPCPDFANKSIRRQGQCSTWTDGYWVQSATIGLPSARGDSTWDEHTWSASSGTVQLKAVVLDSLFLSPLRGHVVALNTVLKIGRKAG